MLCCNLDKQLKLSGKQRRYDIISDADTRKSKFIPQKQMHFCKDCDMNYH